jgi:hypothetical protein
VVRSDCGLVIRLAQGALWVWCLGTPDILYL